MGRILSLLGVLLGVVLARALDAAWVTHWYAGNRALPDVLQAGLDAVFLALAGLVAGRVALWLAGSSARGIGLWVAIWVLAASAVDLVVGLANEPWWHEVITVLVMVPAAALGGGARLPRRHKRVTAPGRLMRFLLRLAATAAALWLAVLFVPGIGWSGSPLGLLGVALVFGLLNALVRPILAWLTCPLIVLTLGLFVFVLNGLMLWLTALLSAQFGLGFTVADFQAAILGALVVGVTSAILNLFVGGPRRRGDD